jgi:hypothetical protein
MKALHSSLVTYLAALSEIPWQRLRTEKKSQTAYVLGSKGYVSGPFSSPPLKDFRTNSILAVLQQGKIRICMNISLPEEASFNDNIAKYKLEKIRMSSAKSFGFSILEAGKDSVMSKFDFVDAYKNIPATLADLRLLGFTWLGKLFVENNMTFAPNCKKNDKAFTCQTWGKVLGINFDTSNLTWSLPDSKKQKTLAAIKNACESDSLSLKEIQRLTGRPNHVSQMAPFLNGFRHNLNEELRKAAEKSPLKIELSEFSKKRPVCLWSNFLSDVDPWLPIPHPREDPPLCTKTFVSDSAGFARSSKWEGDIGCGIIGLDEQGDTLIVHQLFWPRDFIENKKDGKVAKFGDKTCKLEVIGVILPFLLIPEKLKNQHIVCGVDCMGVVYGWENKKVKGDTCASMFIKALHMIEAYLGSRIHIVHAPRRSNWETECADNLSRERTTGFLKKQLLSRFSDKTPVVLTLSLAARAWKKLPSHKESLQSGSYLLNFEKNM